METQERFNSKKTLRNEEIYQARTNGASIGELSQKYGISIQRIRIICDNHAKKRAKESDMLYIAIRVITLDENFASRIYNTLKKNNIHTIEDAKQLTEEKLKKMRCCGHKMTEVIKKLKHMAMAAQ